MAVGVMLGRREISGSCGGLAHQRDADGSVSCSLCSNPDAACKELGRRMDGAAAAGSQENFGTNDCEKDCQAEGCSKEAIDACKGS